METKCISHPHEGRNYGKKKEGRSSRGGKQPGKQVTRIYPTGTVRNNGMDPLKLPNQYRKIEEVEKERNPHLIP